MMRLRPTESPTEVSSSDTTRSPTSVSEKSRPICTAAPIRFRERSRARRCAAHVKLAEAQRLEVQKQDHAHQPVGEAAHAPRRENQRQVQHFLPALRAKKSVGMRAMAGGAYIDWKTGWQRRIGGKRQGACAQRKHEQLFDRAISCSWPELLRPTPGDQRYNGQ